MKLVASKIPLSQSECQAIQVSCFTSESDMILSTANRGVGSQLMPCAASSVGVNLIINSMLADDACRENDTDSSVRQTGNASRFVFAKSAYAIAMSDYLVVLDKDGV